MIFVLAFRLLDDSPLNCFISPGTIEVNVNRPEANREVNVYRLTNIPGVVKTEHRFHGYSIQIPVDIRWSLDEDEVDHYSGRVWKEDALLFRVPAFPYSALHNRDEIHRGGASEMVTIAMDDARHDFESGKDRRQWKYLLLQFPPGHTLSSKMIFEDAGDDEELDFDLVTVTYTHPKVPNYSNMEHWMHFTVARTDLRTTKRGRVEKPAKQSRMAAKLQAAQQAAQGMKTQQQP